MKQFSGLVIVISLIGICPTMLFPQDLTYDYYGQKPPGDNPEVFALGIVSIDNKNSHALVMSPDGKMIIFSRYPDGTSYILSKENDIWTGPVQSFFYGKEVSFSPGGNRIFYYTAGDIFYVAKESAVWSQPVKLGPNVNKTGLTEFYPSIVKSGDLYFSRDGNWATARLMHSKFQNGEYQNAIDLGLPINNGGALHAWFSPDESYVLFNSPRTGSHTGNDIWISFRKEDSTWSDPQNLGVKINSGADAILCPTVSPEGKYMFFTKLNFNTNTGFVYWVSTKFIDSLRDSMKNTSDGKENLESIPKNINLNQNYPNPFNPSTTIIYHLPASSSVKLTVYNMIGQKIKTLVDSFQSIGEHSVVWNAIDDECKSVSSGIYFYTLQAGLHSGIQKLVLLR